MPTETLSAKDKRILARQRNKNWNNNSEMAVQSIGESAQGYLWMNKRSINLYSGRADKFSVLLIFLGLAVSAGPFVAIQYCESGWVAAIFTFASLFVTGLFKTYDYLDYSGAVKDHKQAVTKWSGLVNNIRRQMALYRSDRMNAPDFVQFVSKEYDTLLAITPDIDDKIKQEYIDKFASDGFNDPDEVSHFNVQNSSGSSEEKTDEENQNNEKSNRITKIPSVKSRRYSTKTAMMRKKSFYPDSLDRFKKYQVDRYDM